MKYKIRYTIMTLAVCGLLVWDLSYEYNKPDVTQPAHPVVHTVQKLIAPAAAKPKPVLPPVTIATSTEATSTPPGTATSTPAASSTPIQIGTPTTSPSNPPKRGRPVPLPLPIRTR